ncbi:hypothetical protein Tco_1566724, partial [Tanacetum coccineum]
RKAHLLEEKQIPSVGVFDEVFLALGLHLEEIHQIHEQVLFTERGGGIVGIKRRRRNLSSDDVRDLVTTSGRGRLKKDLESST